MGEGRGRVAELVARQASVRAERTAISGTISGLAADLNRAREAEEGARVQDVIGSSPATVAGVAKAKANREGLEAKLAAARERAELLQRADEKLTLDIQNLDREVRTQERAAAVVELDARIDAGRAQAREWIIDAISRSMLANIVVSDLWIAIAAALEPGRGSAEVQSAVYAAAAQRREAVDAGKGIL